MKAIGKIGGLWRYPVKSLAGEALDGTLLDDSGIVGDRRWALRSELAGELVNCKATPSLLSISAAYAEEPAQGMDVAHAVITLPDGRQLSTRDPLAEAAISAIAGRPLTLWPLQPETNDSHYRLRRPFTPQVTLQRMGLRPDDPTPDFSTYEPDMIQELQYFFSPRGSYKDAYPLHFVTSASLETLTKVRPGVRAEAHRFRPNFLIDTFDEMGLPELEWTGFDLVIGDVVLHCGHKTVRCIMPSQAQMGLDPEPAMGPLLRQLTNLNFGAYCFVRRAGTIRPGDAVFLDTRKDITRITARSLPLPADIQTSEPTDAAEASPAIFARAKISSKEQEVPGVVSIGLKVLSAKPFPFLPGQHVIVSIKPQGHQRPVLRSYSISSAPEMGTGDDYKITVKRIGLVSRHLHDIARIGDEIDVRYPSGRFFALPSADTPLVFISNGIGVTPLFSMLQSAAATNPARPIFWLHATDSSATHLFKRQVETLTRRLKAFEQVIIYRRPIGADVVGKDYQSTGRISPDHFHAIIGMTSPDIFICGSGGFLEDARRFIGGLGVESARVHTERFHVERQGTGNGSQFSVRFARSGIDALWAGGDLTLLEIAEDLGVEVDYGCRLGSCEACSVPMLQGSVTYPDADVRSRPGEILLCSARPSSDIVLDL